MYESQEAWKKWVWNVSNNTCITGSKLLVVRSSSIYVWIKLNFSTKLYKSKLTLRHFRMKRALSFSEDFLHFHMVEQLTFSSVSKMPIITCSRLKSSRTYLFEIPQYLVTIGSLLRKSRKKVSHSALTQTYKIVFDVLKNCRISTKVIEIELDSRHTFCSLLEITLESSLIYLEIQKCHGRFSVFCVFYVVSRRHSSSHLLLVKCGDSPPSCCYLLFPILDGEKK